MKFLKEPQSIIDGGKLTQGECRISGISSLCAVQTPSPEYPDCQLGIINSNLHTRHTISLPPHNQGSPECRWEYSGW